VVIPVFNSANYLARCLEALRAQDYPAERFEVLVVDNNSTDGSVAIAERYDWVRRLHEAKQCSYSTRNTGIRAASGEIVAFLDPDCVPVPGWLSAIARALEDPNRGVVLGKREFDAPSRGLRRLSDYDTVLAEHIYSSDNPGIYFGYCNNMAVKRTLLDEQGSFHEVPRGADTVFVHNAVIDHGCDVVGYDAGVRVVHLEIGSVADFYRKRMYYGTSNSRLRELGTARPLSQRERLWVYSRTVKSCNYSLLQATELLALLSLGVLFYSFGRWRGRLG